MTVVSTVKKPPPLTSSAPCFSFSTSVRGWVSISYWSMSNQPFVLPRRKVAVGPPSSSTSSARDNALEYDFSQPQNSSAPSSDFQSPNRQLSLSEGQHYIWLYCSCVRVNQPKKISSFSAQWKMKVRKSHDHLRSITFGLLGQSQKLPTYEVNRGVLSTCLNTHIARFSFLGSAERLSMVVEMVLICSDPWNILHDHINAQFACCASSPTISRTDYTTRKFGEIYIRRTTWMRVRIAGWLSSRQSKKSTVDLETWFLQRIVPHRYDSTFSLLTGSLPQSKNLKTALA